MKTQEEIFKIKSYIQGLALQAIENNNFWGCLEMATGTGKSKVPIDYIKKYDSQSIGLLVPTEKLRDENWKEEFDKWGASKYWDKVDRHCYASASKVKGKHYNLLICDEGHNLTKRSMKFFQNNTIDCLILLTATVPTNKEKVAIFEELNIKTVYTLTLEEAEELGIIKPFIINVVYTEVDSKRKNVVLTNKKQGKSFLITEKERLDFLNAQVEVTNPYDDLTPSYMISASDKKRYQFAVLQRAQFIYKLQSKAEAAEFLLRAYIPQNSRTLIFTASIDIAEKLCKNSYHSGDKKTSKTNFEAFKKGEIDVLSCVNGLNEGHNIGGVDTALIEQLNSNEINLIQRIGRALRFEVDKSGVVWILVAKDTQDEVWANSALRSFNPSKIRYHYLKDLQQQYVKKFKEINGIKY